MGKDQQKDARRLAKEARRFSRPYRVDDGRRFRLKDVDPGEYWAREWEESILVCAQARKLMPDSVVVQNIQSLVLAAQGDLVGARRAHSSCRARETSSSADRRRASSSAPGT